MLSFMFISLSMFGLAAVAEGTPDGQTPAEEESCLKYEGEGARHGLCIAYCEAQDCRGKSKYEDTSCDRIVDRFVAYSVKKGYVKGPKPKGDRIDCTQSSCTIEDINYCGARGLSLQNPETKECQSFCTSSFEGLNDDGKPLCARTELPKWHKCVIGPVPLPDEEAPAEEAPLPSP